MQKGTSTLKVSKNGKLVPAGRTRTTRTTRSLTLRAVNAQNGNLLGRPSACHDEHGISRDSYSRPSRGTPTNVETRLPRWKR